MMHIPPSRGFNSETITQSDAAGIGRRIFVDCTKTYFFGGGTGIQRVVTELARHAASAGEQTGVFCMPVVWTGIGFLEIGNSSVDGNPRARVLGEWLRRTVLALFKFVKRNVGGQMKTHQESNQSAMRSDRGAGVVSTIARAMFFVLSLIALPKSWLQYRVVRFQRDDVLIMPDANWSNMIPLGALQRIRAKGVHLVSVMHDILPVRVPETFEPSLVSRFKDWLNWACRNVDAMICVSEATRADLNNYFNEQQLRHTPRLGTFRLGSNPNHSNISPRSHIVEQLESIACENWCLCVGTLEPRKNHQILLDACDHLWESGQEFGLVIVGKIGWRCDDVLHRIMHHPRLGEKLLIFHDLNDSELDLAYECATTVIMPSVAEGLGLPIIEALRRNIPVIASDIPPHRETGRDRCFYFDVLESEELGRKIVSVLNGNRPNECFDSNHLNLLDWYTSTLELISKTEELLPRSNSISETGLLRQHELALKYLLREKKYARATRDAT